MKFVTSFYNQIIPILLFTPVQMNPIFIHAQGLPDQDQRGYADLRFDQALHGMLMQA